MRRTARLLLTAATLLSALLCAATITLWIRGQSFEEQIFVARPAANMWLLSNAGDGYLYVAVASGWAGRREWGYSRAALGDREQQDALRPYLFGAFSNAQKVTRRPLHILTFEDTVLVEFGPDDQALSLTSRSGARRSPPMPLRAISVPCWIPTALFALLPTLRASERLRRALTARARARHSQCPTCGYDLRATPTRCPECGATPNTPSPALR